MFPNCDAPPDCHPSCSTAQHSFSAGQSPLAAAVVAQPATTTVSMPGNLNNCRPPVAPEEINCHWVSNLKGSVMARMLETLPLQDEMPRLCNDGILSARQYVRLFNPQAGFPGLNEEVMSTLLANGAAKTFANFLNTLRASIHPVLHQWFTVLTGSELFVIDRSKQLDLLIAAEYESLCQSLPIRKIAHRLCQKKALSSTVRDSLGDCTNHQERVDILLVYLKEGGTACWDLFMSVLAEDKRGEWREHAPALKELWTRLEQRRAELEPTCATLSIATEQLPSSPPVPDVAVNTAVIREDHIQDGWKQRLADYTQRIRSRTELSYAHLETLARNALVDSLLRKECQNPIYEKNPDLYTKNLSLLFFLHIKRRYGKREWAGFLDFLRATREQTPSHGMLFDEIASDPLMMKTLPPLRPAAPAPSPAASEHPQRQLQHMWQQRVRRAHFIELSRHVKLSSNHLDTLKQKGVIPLHIDHDANAAQNTGQRTLLVLRQLLEHGGDEAFSTFLSLLERTRQEVPEHGVLFDTIVSDPAVVKTGCRPIGAAVLPAQSGSAVPVSSAVSRCQTPAAAPGAADMRPSQQSVATQTEPVTEPVQVSVAVQTDDMAPRSQRSAFTQTEPVVSEPGPSAPAASAPGRSQSAVFSVYPQLLCDLRAYLVENLQALHIRNELLQNRAIDYSVYERIQAASSAQEANTVLIEHIEQAADARPWEALLKTLRSECLQSDYPVLQEVFLCIESYYKKRAPSVVAQLRSCSAPTAPAATGPQCLRRHRQVLLRQRTYLIRNLVTHAIANELLQEQAISGDLYERINSTVLRADATEMLINHLERADSNAPWQAFMRVLGFSELQQSHPVLEEIESALLYAINK